MLWRTIRKIIDETLVSEVADCVRETEQEAIDMEVYAVYMPKRYGRRGGHGGLADLANMEARLPGAGVMTICNRTRPNPLYDHSMPDGADVAEIVEYGDRYKGYLYDYPIVRGRFLRPRPFTRRTAIELRQSKGHVEALKNGLKRRGITVV